MKVNWRDIFYLNDHAVCDLIQSDGIDILVDLAGHSSDNCLMVLARQPAPIQITYLGYPGTTGLSQVHYRLVDKHSDPDLTKYCGSEKRLHLPYGFLCYTPLEDAPLISQKTATKQVTFGSFNNLPKVNDRVIALWSKILKAKPGSQLLLKTYGFNDGVVQERYLAGFHQHGIDPDRIQLMGAVQDEKAHLSMYNAVDIALDTFPYNGTTTTCEALWMGVPVITMAGEHHAARVGVSILFQTGLDVWIARDEAEYIQKAIYLAERPDDRVYLRHHLRDWVRQSFLCQKEQFVRAFEGIVAQTIKTRSQVQIK
ncbi:MAG: TPR repeat-containing protein [Candidatus Magnetoglobus multicellularis str. Araruama]|uniref:TPR repeat-containing protein n=1 Tax=Candidatus Magnetoglobus multicellularis str. Araruama TaxID=890399 RepID=A0A1V1P954_9BACT|nr:MAG: TPR repeat-containing protein [Candidatus Magnetoglobus multicellularis str. Araruama]